MFGAGSVRIRAAILVLLLLFTIPLTPVSASHEAPSEKTLWTLGVPRVLDWSKYGLAGGTTNGHILVYDDQGNLKWSRRVNYTEIWDISWSQYGEIAAVSLGPPGTLYVFNDEGELLWSKESELAQAYSVAWSGDLLAAAIGDLQIFDRGGRLIWGKNGSVLTISWYNDLLAAIACLEGLECTWGIYVFNKNGDLLWSFPGSFHFISWSNTGDMAVAGKYDGTIYVFDQSGKLKWRKHLDVSELGAITWYGDLLAIGSKGVVIAFDKDGEAVWTYDTKEYFVEMLSTYKEFLAIGSQSGNLTLLDSQGRPVWGYWTCGYIWAFSGYEDLIAIASSDGYVHALDEDGNLLWKRKIGFLVQATSVHDGLIAAGGWELNIFVLDAAGNIKWSKETGWVSHLAWYEDLLAVGGYERLLVFNKDGDLKWSFETGKVRSLSWSNDGLLAIGASDRFGVFSKDGTLLWSHTSPDWVISLSWHEGLLAVGIAGNGVFLFDKNGNLKWFFKSIKKDATIPWRVSASWWNDILIVVTDATYAFDGDGNLLWAKDQIYGPLIAPGKDFVAFGGGRGVYVLDEDGEIEWNYTSPEIVRPKEYFTKLYPCDIFSLNWVGNYLVAGDWLGRVFLFNETGDLIWIYNMGDGVQSISTEDNIFVSGGGGGALIKELPIISKPPRKVLPELPKPYNKFTPIHGETLPSFEERRVYLPIGIADYGIAELPEGIIGYRYEYTEAWALAEIRELYTIRAFDNEETKHGAALQLNAFLHVEVKGGQQVYWIQNVVNIETENKLIRVINNIWNVTTYPTSILMSEVVKGNGSMERVRRFGDYYFYIAGEWTNYHYPLNIILSLSTRVENGIVKIYFGQSLEGSPLRTYDMVSLKINARSAYFRVDPTATPIPSNIEFVFTGPTGAKPKTAIERINASLRLFVNVSGEIIPIPTAYSHGYTTHERVKGIAARYGGDYDVILSSGKALPTQIYYSTEILPSFQLIQMHDPLGIFDGLRFMKTGEELDIPRGYLLDLGNMTRLVLKGYQYTGRNEVVLDW
ncbi:thermopsin family protease, partial [Candidatus Bathyarchaeota archaeon]|nr:thermopsin family protease [Candidatus Bathyarchaeota archaeon]